MKDKGTMIGTITGTITPTIKDYLVKWFIGPLGDQVKGVLVREVGFCVGDLKTCSFQRSSYLLPGFLQLWESKLSKVFDRANIFMGVGYWAEPGTLEPELDLMRYDRISFDFDLPSDPEAAVEAALGLAKAINARYQATPVVFRSGFKGAHVVIPLSKPVDWNGYQLIRGHFMQLIPREMRSALDEGAGGKWRDIDRVPLTWNLKEGKRVLARIIYPREFTYRDFDWSSLQPLDPSKVVITRPKLPEIPKPKELKPKPKPSPLDTSKPSLPASIRELGNSELVPPCVRKWINTIVETGELDHYERVSLALYLKWVGFSPEDVINFFREYARDFKENITRYQVEYLYGLRGSRREWLMYSCNKLRELGLCLDCGWNRNPVTYTYAKAYVDPELKEKFFSLVKKDESSNLPKPSAEVAQDQCFSDEYYRLVVEFTRETGLEEFTYGDLKSWLEGKQEVSADYWHTIERKLRELASSGCLGRRYLVDGEWVDYGTGPVSTPPSREVKFYIATGC